MSAKEIVAILLGSFSVYWYGMVFGFWGPKEKQDPEDYQNACKHYSYLESKKPGLFFVGIAYRSVRVIETIRICRNCDKVISRTSKRLK